MAAQAWHSEQETRRGEGGTGRLHAARLLAYDEGGHKRRSSPMEEVVALPHGTLSYFIDEVGPLLSLLLSAATDEVDDLHDIPVVKQEAPVLGTWDDLLIDFHRDGTICQSKEF